MSRVFLLEDHSWFRQALANLLEREPDLEVIGEAGSLFVLLAPMLQSIGLLLPAQTILLAAGVMVSQGILNPVYAVGFGLAGALAGSQIGYQLGRRGGRGSVLRWGRYVGLGQRRLEYAEKLLGGHAAGWAVLVARFVPVLKTFGYPPPVSSACRAGGLSSTIFSGRFCGPPPRS